MHCHVDGYREETQRFESTLINNIKETFSKIHKEFNTLKYLGLNIKQTSD